MKESYSEGIAMPVSEMDEVIHKNEMRVEWRLLKAMFGQNAWSRRSPAGRKTAGDGRLQVQGMA